MFTTLRTTIAHVLLSIVECVLVLPLCRSDTCVDRWRGQVQNFDLNGRSHAGHILQPQKTRMSWTAFLRTPTNTKKSLRTISRLKTLSKHGGFLLSHLVWQYHRR